MHYSWMHSVLTEQLYIVLQSVFVHTMWYCQPHSTKQQNNVITPRLGVNYDESKNHVLIFYVFLTLFIMINLIIKQSTLFSFIDDK